MERARCSEQLWADAQARAEGLEEVWHEDGMALGAALKRVEELESWHKESGETTGAIAIEFVEVRDQCDEYKQKYEECHADLVMMMHQRNAAEKRLEAVMIEATNRPLDTTVAIARAAGYVLCEKCRGIGVNRDHDYPEDCPKCGGLGWRKRRQSERR